MRGRKTTSRALSTPQRREPTRTRVWILKSQIFYSYCFPPYQFQGFVSPPGTSMFSSPVSKPLPLVAMTESLANAITLASAGKKDCLLIPTFSFSSIIFMNPPCFYIDLSADKRLNIHSPAKGRFCFFYAFTFILPETRNLPSLRADSSLKSVIRLPLEKPLKVIVTVFTSPASSVTLPPAKPLVV